MSQYTSISYLGLGAMGSALAHSSLKKLTVHAWNRTPTRPDAQKLVESGAKQAATPTAAFEASDLIILCLLDYPSVYQVLETIPEKNFSGKTIINLTTSNASEGPAMETWMSKRGVKVYFEGAIMTIPQLVGTEQAFIYISGGDEAAFADMEPAVNTIGKLEYLGSDPSSAALYDGSLLAGMYGMFGGCITAIAMLSKDRPATLGLNNRKATVNVVKNHLLPFLASMGEWIAEAAECYDKEDWGGYTASNEVNYHAVENVLKSCEATGVDGRCLKEITRLFERSCEDGKGGGGLAYTVNYLLQKGKANGTGK